ncbi:hypothetical protein ILUMI_21549 [Ignelater luminosus]|uniref:PiggyBac transposable element-derived protein domain-containing protein n=1 Tax=Ignelater luminosus TaxID=2038154 RepID=A0A8K0CHI6_IGNLU|nr:hypothetical protein ILUMI_21549 [Ignelater luminosus]
MGKRNIQNNELRSGPVAWAPRNPDSNPSDFFLWESDDDSAEYIIFNNSDSTGGLAVPEIPSIPRMEDVIESHNNQVEENEAITLTDENNHIANIDIEDNFACCKTRTDISLVLLGSLIGLPENTFMEGVDHADHPRTVYGLNRRSKKRWHKLFLSLIDVTFVNAYMIFCDIREKQSLLEFRSEVAMGLMTHKVCATPKRQRENIKTGPFKQRRGASYSVPADVRFSKRGSHWVKYLDQRGRCEAPLWIVKSRKGLGSQGLQPQASWVGQHAMRGWGF